MRTVTLELPEYLADRLEAMSADERNHFATAALSAAIEDEEETAPTWTPEDLASIGRGLAETESGQGRPGAEVMDELRRELGLPARRKQLSTRA